jgi:general secretion pathway protein A
MYTAYYGFREFPFNVTPDPRFLYLNDTYQEAIAALRYGIEGRRGFVALIGEAGTGKTTLLRRLLDSFEGTVRTVLLLHPTVSFDEILEHILSELGIPTDGARKLVLLQRLNEYLLEHTTAGGNVAILIDEAQDLETRVLEELRLLSNLETGSEKILQIILAGQPELDARLADPALRQLRQRITLNVRIRPLDAPETAAYVRTRLEKAGARDLDIFTPEALEKIAQVTSGIPRLVNVLCDACLMAGFATGQSRVGVQLVEDAWADYDRGTETPQTVPAAMSASKTAPAAAVPAAPVPTIAAPPVVEPPVVVAPPAPAPVVAPAPAPAPVAAAPAPVAAEPPIRTLPEPFAIPVAPPAPRSNEPERVEPQATPVPLFQGVRTTAPGLSIPVAAALVLVLAVALYALGRRDGRPIPPFASSAPTAVRPVAPQRPTPAPMPAAPTAPPEAATASPPSPPAAAGATTPGSEAPPTVGEARAVAERFRSAYESRDVDGLLKLFSTDATENGRQGLEAIAADYRQAFESMGAVRYTVPSVEVIPRGARVAVRGPFVISYLEGAGDEREVRGEVEWQIERREGRPVIVALKYHFGSEL